MNGGLNYFHKWISAKSLKFGVEFFLTLMAESTWGGQGRPQPRSETQVVVTAQERI